MRCRHTLCGAASLRLPTSTFPPLSPLLHYSSASSPSVSAAAPLPPSCLLSPARLCVIGWSWHKHLLRLPLLCMPPCIPLCPCFYVANNFILVPDLVLSKLDFMISFLGTGTAAPTSAHLLSCICTCPPCQIQTGLSSCCAVAKDVQIEM